MNRLLRKAIHLERRFFRALSDRPPTAGDIAWAHGFLSTAERGLWDRMQNQDKRHSLEVAKRFVLFASETSAAGPPDLAVAAALMHDVGKIESRLGTFSRVLAAFVKGPTKRLRAYHDHERIGAELLRGAGSDPELIALVEETSTNVALADALRRADNI